MTGYVIRRTDQGGGYLHHDPARSGTTYTHRLELARVFPTLEAADKERCHENEVAVPLAACFAGSSR